MIDTIRTVLDDALTHTCAGLLAVLADQHQAGRLTDEQLAEAQAAVREHIAAARAAVARALGEYVR
ncbi:hypothetical protein AZOA_47910 [Azoarcus sp. Aa7]|nr:hypothetical protein [Azoarcus sp. Aa7]